MICLIPPACVFCRHYHHEYNDRNAEIPSCDAFEAIPDEIFMGQFDHSDTFPGDNGVKFSLIETERDNFLELNAVRGELGLMTYRIAPEGFSIPELPASVRVMIHRKDVVTSRPSPTTPPTSALRPGSGGSDA